MLFRNLLSSILLYTCCFIFTNNQLWASDQAQHPLVLNYMRNDYHAGSQNWDITSDSLGYIYFANHKGLLAYDGENWELFQLPSHNVIRSLAYDSETGRIYSGSLEEFGFWLRDDYGSLHYTSISDSLTNFRFMNEEIWKIVIHNQQVYFQTFSKIFRYDPKSRNVKMILPPNNIVFLLKAGNQLWTQVIDEGIYQFDGENFSFIKGSEFLGKGTIRVALPLDSVTTLLGSADDGLFIYRDSVLQAWNSPASELLRNSQVNNGLVMHNGLIAIGTLVKGLAIIDQSGNVVSHLSTEGFLKNNTILSVHQDRNHNVWTGLDNGISNIIFNSLFKYNVNPKQVPGKVFSVVFGSDGFNYLGTNQGVFYCKQIPDNKYGWNFDDYQLVPGTQGHVWTLQEIDGEIICGHTNGTFRIKSGNSEILSDIKGGSCIKKITNEDQTFLLQSSYSKLIVYPQDSNGEWDKGHPIEEFNKSCRFLETDYMGNIWASHHKKGVFQVRLESDLKKTSSVKFYGRNKGFPSDYNINVFKINNRIVFTTGHQLYTYDDMTDRMVPHIKLNNALGEFKKSSHVIQKSLYEYWFIHENTVGLFLIDNEETKLIDRYNFSGVFALNDQFQNISVQDNMSAICLENGYALYNAKEFVTEKSYTKPIFIKIENYSSIDKNNRMLLPTMTNQKPVILPNKMNSLKFVFSSMYPGETEHKYQYRILELDSLWSEGIFENFIVLNNLPDGDYQFQIRFLASEGKYSPINSYPFQIEGPWYTSTKAILLIGIGYLLLILGTIRLSRRIIKQNKVKALKKQSKEFEEKRKEEQTKSEREIMRIRNEALRNEIASKNKELTISARSLLEKDNSLQIVKGEVEKIYGNLLGRFPRKDYEKLIAAIDKQMSHESDKDNFDRYFNETHSGFFKSLKEDYPQLSSSDLRLSALLRMSLTSKEIAPLLNITVRSVEVGRYRLRKKLSLEGDDNLVEFLLKY